MRGTKRRGCCRWSSFVGGMTKCLYCHCCDVSHEEEKTGWHGQKLYGDNYRRMSKLEMGQLIENVRLFGEY